MGINPTGWSPHEVTFLNPDKVLETIARDNYRTPEIVERGPIVGTLFPILCKYPDTVKILTNYIQKTVKELMQIDDHARISVFVESYT